MKSSGGGRVNSAQMAKQLEDKLLRNHNVVLFFAIAGIALMIAENYTLWSHGGEPDGTCEVLKLATSFSTAFLLLFLYVYHRRKFDHSKITNAGARVQTSTICALAAGTPEIALLQRDTFISSGILVSFVIEAAFYAIHAPPFVNLEFETHYFDLQQGRWLSTILTSDELGTLFMLFARSYLVMRSLRYLSGVESQQTRGYSNFNNLNVTTGMSLRMLYQRYPLLMMSGLTALLLPALAFALQLAERKPNHNLDSFPNCLWLMVVSTSSVGFGDFVPLTPLGRAMDALAVCWGFVLYAASVEILLRISKLSKGEARVSKTLLDQIGNTRMRQRAAFYIQAAWTSYLERLQREQSATHATSLTGNEPLQSDAKFCRAMRSFRELRKSMMQTAPPRRPQGPARAAAQTDDDIILIFKEVLDSRSRLESRLRDLDEKLDEMDAKFEHNIAAMNELLQKNLKYLKHVAS